MQRNKGLLLLIWKTSVHSPHLMWQVYCPTQQRKITSLFVLPLDVGNCLFVCPKTVIWKLRESFTSVHAWIIHACMNHTDWLDLHCHVMMYEDVQTYARFLQRRSELRMISSMTSRIMNDFDNDVQYYT